MSNAVLGFLIVNTALLVILVGVVMVCLAVILDRTRHIAAIGPMLETVIQFISTGSTEEGGMGGPPPIFRSMDGKFSASSLEELISKMQADPNSGLTERDAEELRNMFKGLSEDLGDDDDDDLEEWQKKGKK